MSIFYTDGSANNLNPEDRNARYIVVDENGKPILRENIGNKTSNQAEYEGMIACLKYIEQNNLHSVIIYSDSTIIVNQTNATWRIKESSPLLSEGLRARELYTNLCFGEPELLLNGYRESKIRLDFILIVDK